MSFFENLKAELENKLTVFSKMIGEEFIIKINNYLLSIKRQNFISNNPSYTSSCDFQSINSIYLNNILEQDHLSIKRRIAISTGFKEFEAAQRTLAGIEIINMIRKNQILKPKSSTFKTFCTLAS